MGLFDKVLGNRDYYDEFEDEFENESDFGAETKETAPITKQPERQQGKVQRRVVSQTTEPQKIVNVAPSHQQEVVIVEPRNHTDAQKICNDLKAGRTVICNLERIDPVITQRVIDFILGGTFSLNGKVTTISNSTIFVITPSNVAVTDQITLNKMAEQNKEQE